MEWNDLILAAARARENAYCSYSGFAVGAAVETGSGQVFTGCNVENRTYGLTVCAERVAIASAVAAGERQIVRIAVVTEATPPATPCGPCREVITEFAAPETPVLLANSRDERLEYRLDELLPHPFIFEPQID